MTIKSHFQLRIIILICPLLFILNSFAIVTANDLPIDQIAFLSKRSGKWEVYIMDSDGSNQRSLAHKAKEGSLTWSPDGKQLAYNQSVDMPEEIYVMDADGSNQHRLTDKPVWNSSPAWSPDGSQIAFIVAKPDSINEIYLFDVATHTERLLSQYGRWGDLSWSPDGSQLVLQLVSRYYQSGGVYTDIYTIDSDGQNRHPLTEDEVFAHAPQWSPDGRQIAYLSDRGGTSALYVMNSNGSNQRRFTDNQVDYAYGPQWSPDSQSVAFVLASPGELASKTQYDIYTVDIDTGSLRNLTNGEGTNNSPVWSPDGNTIAFISDREDGISQVYVMDSDGTNLKQLTNSIGGNTYPAWQPAPTS